MKIGVFDVEIVGRLFQERKSYPLCDKDGNLITTESTKGKREYKNSEGTLISATYRLINGKAMAKFSKTRDIKRFEEVSKTEVFNLRTEEYFFCNCDSLKEHLKQKDTALKFIYTNGNGFKAYESYLFVFQDELVMVCGFGQLSDLLVKMKAKQSEKESNLIVEEVERANPEELMEIAVSTKKAKTEE